MLSSVISLCLVGSSLAGGGLVQHQGYEGIGYGRGGDLAEVSWPFESPVRHQGYLRDSIQATVGQQYNTPVREYLQDQYSNQGIQGDVGGKLNQWESPVREYLQDQYSMNQATLDKQFTQGKMQRPLQAIQGAVGGKLNQWESPIMSHGLNTFGGFTNAPVREYLQDQYSMNQATIGKQFTQGKMQRPLQAIQGAVGGKLNQWESPIMSHGLNTFGGFTNAPVREYLQDQYSMNQATLGKQFTQGKMQRPLQAIQGGFGGKLNQWESPIMSRGLNTFGGFTNAPVREYLQDQYSMNQGIQGAVGGKLNQWESPIMSALPVREYLQDQYMVNQAVHHQGAGGRGKLNQSPILSALPIREQYLADQYV